MDVDVQYLLTAGFLGIVVWLFTWRLPPAWRRVFDAVFLTLALAAMLLNVYLDWRVGLILRRGIPLWQR